MKREHDDMTSDDGIEALLREVGARDEPSATAKEEVRRAVHDEWRATVAQRKRRRRLVALAMAASVALIAIMANWTLRLALPDADIPVVVVRIDGEARLQATPADPSRTVRIGDTIEVGSALTTDDATRMALAFGSATSLRLDRGSRIERKSPERFRLTAGAVYVDAHPRAEDRRLVIETLAGAVRHLGTQYQIRHSAEAIEVSIREGRVEIERADGAALASAGERVRITKAGDIERGAISAQDRAWEWAQSASPVFEIDNRTLAEFLDWAARETGRRVVYATPAAQREAETLRLHGSIEGLDPQSALSAVLSTTELRQYESGDDLIGIRLAD